MLYDGFTRTGGKKNRKRRARGDNDDGDAGAATAVAVAKFAKADARAVWLRDVLVPRCYLYVSAETSSLSPVPISPHLTSKPPLI